MRSVMRENQKPRFLIFPVEKVRDDFFDWKGVSTRRAIHGRIAITRSVMREKQKPRFLIFPVEKVRDDFFDLKRRDGRVDEGG